MYRSVLFVAIYFLSVSQSFASVSTYYLTDLTAGNVLPGRSMQTFTYGNYLITGPAVDASSALTPIIDRPVSSIYDPTTYYSRRAPGDWVQLYQYNSSTHTLNNVDTNNPPADAALYLISRAVSVNTTTNTFTVNYFAAPVSPTDQPLTPNGVSSLSSWLSGFDTVTSPGITLAGPGFGPSGGSFGAASGGSSWNGSMSTWGGPSGSSGGPSGSSAVSPASVAASSGKFLNSMASTGSTSTLATSVLSVVGIGGALAVIYAAYRKVKGVVSFFGK